ncbi:MAG: Crp/Fnr family transcriptional regulator [Deltaproteobacteria bacterium]|nr:Crp/Fnr family transcriptional regulator [Deltaproteobacteria bacterium]
MGAHGIKARDSICGICQCRIKENTLFANLSEDELDLFKDVVTTSFHRKKEVIFMEGDECRGLYVVRMGRVKIVRTSKDGKEQIIKILSAGDLLGLEVFYDGKTYGNNAVAMEDSDLCFVKKGDFFRMMEKEPHIASKLVRALGRELHHAYERIGNLGLMNAKEKLAHLLYTLAKEYGVPDTRGVRLNLTFSRLEIAELLGITQETSIRLLKGFKEAGVLSIKRKEIVIASMDRLAEIGGLG